MKSLICIFATSILPLAAQEPNTLTAKEKSEGFKLLFDGGSLENFRNFKSDSVNPKWQAADGTITLTERGGGNLMTREKFRDFEFRFQFKIAANGNSGIMWHVSEDYRKPHETGPEYQILDAYSKTAYAKEIEKGNISGALYDLVPAKSEWSKPAGEWNNGSIKVSGSQITFTINGNISCRVDTDTENWKILISQSKFSKLPMFNKVGEGHLVFQDHGDIVSFRSLRIKELK